MIEQDERLRNLIEWRRKARPKAASRLADELTKIMENKISPRQTRFAAMAPVWSQLLPAELQQHCEIADLRGGELKVRVDLPAYANELRWCKAEVLEQLQLQCPRAKIQKITVVVG